MRKFLLYIFSLLTVVAFTVAPAFAEGTEINPCPNNPDQFGRLCSLDEASLPSIISLAVTVLLVVAVLISLFFLIFGGIKWILSGGDKAGVETARNMIVAAIVGLIIAFLAYFILTLVLGFFNIDLKTLELPKLAI